MSAIDLNLVTDETLGYENIKPSRTVHTQSTAAVHTSCMKGEAICRISRGLLCGNADLSGPIRHNGPTAPARAHVPLADSHATHLKPPL